MILLLKIAQNQESLKQNSAFEIPRPIQNELPFYDAYFSHISTSQNLGQENSQPKEVKKPQYPQ